jgi:uncharacterized protein YrzB (UPF0473 family)
MEQDIYTNQDPLEIEMESVDGEKVKVRITRLFEDNGKNYVVADNMDEDESYIFQIIPHDDGDELISIDSDEEFDRLVDVLEKQLEAEEE